MSLVYHQDVVDAICEFLENHSFDVEQALTSMHPGVDIIAARVDSDETKIYVDVKGETSSKESSSTLGKAFNSAQTKDHVADALYKAAKMLGDVELAEDRRVAVAFPKTELHRKFEGPIDHAFQDLGVGVFWVDREMKVDLDAPWELE